MIVLVFTRKEKEEKRIKIRGKKGKAKIQKGKWGKNMRGKRGNKNVFLLYHE